MWCSAFYDFADVRAVAVNRDRQPCRQQTALTREWRENEPPRITDPHPAPSSARPRCTELRRSEQGQHSARGQHRGSSGVIAFTIRRAVCRCHLLSPSPPRAAPTRRSDDQSTACPALPMPSRAAGRSPRREEPVEEVLIRVSAFRAMAKMASFRGILNIKSLNYELMSENSDYCVSGRDCPSVILSSAVSGAPR